MRFDCSGKGITSISNYVLDGASQVMDSGVYLVQCVPCPTVPNSGVLVGNAGFRAVFIEAETCSCKLLCDPPTHS